MFVMHNNIQVLQYSIHISLATPKLSALVNQWQLAYILCGQRLRMGVAQMLTDCFAGVRQENLRPMRHSWFCLCHNGFGTTSSQKKDYSCNLLTFQGNTKGTSWTFKAEDGEGDTCKNGGCHTRLGQLKESKVFRCGQVWVNCERCEPCHNGFIQITLPMWCGIMNHSKVHTLPESHGRFPLDLTLPFC